MNVQDARNGLVGLQKEISDFATQNINKAEFDLKAPLANLRIAYAGMFTEIVIKLEEIKKCLND